MGALVPGKHHARCLKQLMLTRWLCIIHCAVHAACADSTPTMQAGAAQQLPSHAAWLPQEAIAAGRQPYYPSVGPPIKVGISRFGS